MQQHRSAARPIKKIATRASGAALIWVMVATGAPAGAEMRVQRLQDNPVLSVSDAPGLEQNINGPSAIRVPDWVENPLGRYYLYFAHHQGKYIRLAYADRPEGPYRVHEPGTLRLEDSGFPEVMPPADTLPEDRRYSVEAGRIVDLYPHIASPDVHVVPEQQQIRMYFHGQHESGHQLTRAAVSRDGIHFEARGETLGRPYFRAFRHQDHWYALAMPGVFYRSADGLTGFETGPTLFDRNMRHSAVLLRGDTLHVFYTRAGDAPEAILHTTVDLSGPWKTWRESASTLFLKPEAAWEGARLPVAPSARGAVLEPVNQLRDPAILETDGRVLLFYAVQGERGIGVAEITDP